MFEVVDVTAPSVGAIVAISLAVLLLFASGFVSASEIAFFSLSPNDLNDIEEENHSSDKHIKSLLADTERLLATILISNNFVNVMIIMLCNFFFSKVIDFGTSVLLEFLLITVILTFLLLLFGEIMPKIYSAQYTLKFCRFSAPVLTVLKKVFSPLSALLVKSSIIVNKCVSKKNYSISVDDLSQALELTDKDEISEESNILEGIIRFGDETAVEIMTPRLDIVDLEIHTPFSEVLKCVVENAYSRIPVYGKTQDDIRGILYIKDLIPHLNRGENFRWQSLIRQPFFVPETKKIDDLLCDFQTVKVHMAVVVDEFGGVSGLITLEDIIEEIVGEINDEFDEPDSSYERVDERTYLFDGRTSLSDFYKITSMDSEEFEELSGEADTLAGLLLEVKGEFPMLHEVIVCNDVSFEVVQKDKHRIAKIKAVLPSAFAGAAGKEVR